MQIAKRIKKLGTEQAFHVLALAKEMERKGVDMIHMEIGDADPVAIRDILLEFGREDQNLEEPLIDIWARRLGF